MIEFDALSKVYGRGDPPAVSGLSFQVRNGEVLGFVGLNGAGKTTSIRVAAGLLLPTGGTVRVDDHDVVEEKVEASAQLGLVPESPLYEPQARARSLLEYFAAYHGIDRPTARRRATDLLALAGLSALEEARLRTFSLGMRKRYAIAAALVNDPQNLLLDEVLNGLDPAGLSFVRSWLGELRRSGRAVLLSSHNLAELQEVVDRVAFIHDGQLLKVVPRDEFARAGRKAVVIQFVPVDDRALALLAQYGTPERQRADTVAVRDLRGDPAEIVRALVAQQYRVAEVRPEEPPLEAYFLDLVRAGS